MSMEHQQKKDQNIIHRSLSDPHDRSPHQYMVDGFTQAFLDAQNHPELWDAVIVREKDYFYTTRNTSIEDIKDVGRPREVYGERKGDWDFAVIFPELEHVDWYEFSKSGLSSESKRHPSDLQEERFIDSVNWTNRTCETDLSYETEIFFAEDYNMVFEDHPRLYEGSIAFTDRAREIFEQSDAMDALNKFNFDDALLKSKKIRPEN